MDASFVLELQAGRIVQRLLADSVLACRVHEICYNETRAFGVVVRHEGPVN